MAHDIDFTKGKAAMAFAGDRNNIWHRLGQQMPEDATLEQWLTESGMDWRILRSKVRFAPAPGAATVEWPEHHVLLRSDSRTPLAIVSDNYKVVQPKEIIGFFGDLIREAGFRMTTAGVLHGGRRFWAQADLGEGDDVVRGDFVGARLLLATSCDGSMQTVAKGVSMRVVCANTLGYAMNESGGSTVRVSHRSVFNEARVKAQLGFAPIGFARFIKSARELSKREVSPAEATAFVLELFGGKLRISTAAEIERNVKVENSAGYQKVLSLFRGEGKGSNLPGVRGTAWGLLNGVTEYVDHHKRARSEDNRFDSAEFGAGDELKTRALDAALALLD